MVLRETTLPSRPRGSSLDVELLRRAKPGGGDSSTSTSSIDDGHTDRQQRAGDIATGRQRKKFTSRKSQFYTEKKRKRRIYFCSISNEINIDQLYTYISCETKWVVSYYEDVLHVYIPGKIDELSSFKDASMSGGMSNSYITNDKLNSTSKSKSSSNNLTKVFAVDGEDDFDFNMETDREFYEDTDGEPVDIERSATPQIHPRSHVKPPAAAASSSSRIANPVARNQNNSLPAASLYNHGHKEVFIFTFGTCVFWNFSLSDEAKLIEHISEFAVKGTLSKEEFAAGHDDMAFSVEDDADIDAVTISNDVIIMPEFSPAKVRLSISFAIAQSAVLAVFEERVNQKICSYQYIPEVLSAVGRLSFSPQELGNMTGEIYVIRHDINLHTEILDTPDFFWKEDIKLERIYLMTERYLDMDNRIAVLNKRLDMLRELLSVLSRQHQNSHLIKLEWIIVWLIVVSIVLELVQYTYIYVYMLYDLWFHR